MLAGFLDLCHDGKRGVECIAPHLAGYRRLLAVLDRMDEGFQFVIKRIAFIEIEFLDLHSGDDTIQLVLIRMNQRDFVVRKIDRNICIFLKQPQLALILGGNPAGGDIGHGAIDKR